MSLFLELIGFRGLIFSVGILTFIFCYKYSVNIFDWIERQTYGTRSYITEKLEFLFIEIPQNKLTYLLLGSSVGLGMVTFLALGFFANWIAGSVAALFISFVGFKMPKIIVDYLVEKRIKAYAAQMVDGLQLLSNGIRAGLSVPQAIGMIVEEMPAPISQEFNILLQQNRIGVPLEECFDNLAKRVPSEDNDMFVSSVNILRETGGNLAETFDTIIEVIRERVRLQQKADTAIAAGMMQALTIGSMPFFLGVVFFIQDPNSMMPLFTTPLGIVLLIIALALDFTGIFVILKIVKIKI